MFLIRHAASPGAAERRPVRCPSTVAVSVGGNQPFEPGRNLELWLPPHGLAVSCRSVEPVSGGLTQAPQVVC